MPQVSVLSVEMFDDVAGLNLFSGDVYCWNVGSSTFNPSTTNIAEKCIPDVLH